RLRAEKKHRPYAQNDRACLSLGDLGEGVRNGRDVDDDVRAFHLKRQAHWIAAARLANRGNVNRRSTVTANHILPVLTVAFRAANPARIERHAPALRLFDHQETKILRS